MNARPVIQVLLMVALLNAGCGKGSKMDYGQPEAQFLQEEVVEKGRAFVGKKITVKGTVAKVDVSDPKSARIHLEGGIECNLGKFKAMAESCKLGEPVYVDGFLKRCEKGDVVIEPAMLRDPTAPFKPN